MIKLYIKNTTGYKFKYKRLFKKIAKLVISSENITLNSELSLIIINNKEMKSISKKYKNVDKATDILTFPSDFEKLSSLIQYNMLGDIYMSYEKILKQAKDFNHSTKREWAYIFAHGMFHLLGYDHIKNDEEKKMNDKVDSIMKKIGVTRNEKMI